MEPVHITHFHIDDLTVDRFGYLKPSAMLFFAQEAAGQHCISLGTDYETLAQRRLFWAIIRQRLTVTRLPAGARRSASRPGPCPPPGWPTPGAWWLMTKRVGNASAP